MVIQAYNLTKMGLNKKMETENNYGILMHKTDIELHRKNFKELTRLLGINVLYYAPKDGKKYTTYTELSTNFENPISVGCIFEEHPTQQTLKKMRWVAELQENESIIHLPYDLQKLQRGALLLIPDAINPKCGRLFRVEKMEVGMIYPATVVCSIVPEYEDTMSDDSYKNFAHTSFNLLNEG